MKEYVYYRSKVKLISGMSVPEHFLIYFIYIIINIYDHLSLIKKKKDIKRIVYFLKLLTYLSLTFKVYILNRTKYNKTKKSVQSSHWNLKFQ